MPSKSAKQHRFMQAVAHNSAFAKKAGVPQSVGREYVSADKGRFAGGGKVLKLKDLYQTVIGKKPAPEVARRIERLVDENPGVDKMVMPSTLLEAAHRSPGLLNLDAQDYLDLAAPVGDVYQPIFNRELNKLRKRLNTSNKMEFLPELRIRSGVVPVGDRKIVQILDHDGRHRAVILGERGLKVPTEIYYPNYQDALSKPFGVAEHLKGKSLRSEYGNRLMDLGDDTAFAGGGKVKKLSQWIRDMLPGSMDMPYSPRGPYHDVEGFFGANSHRYSDLLKDWDPLIPEEHYSDLERWALGDMSRYGADPKVIDELANVHGVDLRDVASPNDPLMRVIGVNAKTKQGMYDTLSPFTTTAHQSTTISDRNLEDFVDSNMGAGSSLIKFQIEPKGPVKVLPMPISGQSEFILPRGIELRHLDRFEDDQGILNYVMQAMGKKHYADGGTVLERDLQRSNNLQGKNKFERLNAVAVRGLASMLGTLDEDTGQVGWGGRPGLIDEFIGLPAAFSDNAPEWAQAAARRSERLRGRVHEMMPDVVPTGTLENIVEAGGEMAGQLPIPAGWVGKLGKLGANAPKYLKYTGKIPGAFMEYLSPTINPSVGNYVSGAVAGGLLGNLAEPDMLEPTDFENYEDPYEGGGVPFPNSPLIVPEKTDMNDLTSMVRKYGGGGKVRNVERIVNRLSRKGASQYDFARARKFARKLNSPEAHSALNRAADAGGRFDEMGLEKDYFDLEDNLQLFHDLMKKTGRFAGGGKVMGAASAIRAIKNAISHLENNDRMSAIRELSTSKEAMASPNVQRIMQMLRGPENRMGLPSLRKEVEADTNATTMPLLAGGGKVKSLMYPLRVEKRLKQRAEDGAPIGGLDSLEKAVLEALVDKGEMVRVGNGQYRSTFRTYPIQKAGGGKVAKVFKSVDWKDELSPSTRRVVQEMDAKRANRRVVPDRRLAPRFNVDDVDISDVLLRRRPHFVKPEDLE